MKKHNLSSIAFIIPYYNENDSRETALRIVVDYLQYHLETNIIIVESGEKQTANFKGCETIFVPTKHRVFHKTFLLNVGTLFAKQKILVNYDADVLLPISQLLKAVQAMYRYPFCFPYNQGLINIKKDVIMYVRKPEDTHGLLSQIRPATEKKEAMPDGGCFVYRKAEFIEAGMENEFFLNYSLEDAERKRRIKILGYEIKYINGYIYHLEHSKSDVSTWKNQFYKQGEQLFSKISAMKKQELKEYIKTFHWVRRKKSDITK